jgi:uncharacterized membrane protein YeiH
MYLFYVLELIGTVAFAISGAVIGIRKEMDVFGVAILGLTTALGGGVIRDLILNITPPAAFQDPVLALTAIIVSILVFIRPVRTEAARKKALYEKLLLIMDAIGLGLFTVLGVQVAIRSTVDTNLFLVTFVGVITGVGGGMLRDIFAGIRPYIFVKHFYACASIIGAWTCALLWPYAGSFASMIIGASLVVVLRLLAAHYRWSLPKAHPIS